MTLNLKPVDLDKVSAKNQARIKWEERIVMPKWDGCFTIVLFEEDGSPAGVLSREGTKVLSCDHFYSGLRLYDAKLSEQRRFAVLGEAWKPDTPFKDISGAYRRHTPQPDLQFMPFDFVWWGGDASAPKLYSELQYIERLRNLSTYPLYSRTGLSYSQTVDVAELYKYSMVGRDGAISADPWAPYVPGSGRAGEFIKIKPLASKALEVLEVVAGEGAVTGRATAALVVRLWGGLTCKVGTGFSTQEAADWVANPALIVGQTIEVTYMGIHEGGVLREPRYEGIRHDTKPEH